MKPLCVAVLSILIGVCWCDRRFPTGFKFGAATSAYQSEGGWNASDKGVSVWDHLIHTHPELVEDGTNGDVATDSYHRWQDDIQMVSDMGLHFYRFSICWPRILPTGLPDKISEDGKKFYNNLIDGLLEKGIEPVATIYHWDIPQRLQNLGGWTNPLVTEWFADYARVVYSLYADRVKTWITINEPSLMCDGGYNMGIVAPSFLDPGFGNYLCLKNVFIAHAKAWRIYDEEFRDKYHGEVGLTNHIMWMEPVSEEDRDLNEIAMEFGTGLYSHPIFSEEGGWPPIIEKIIAENSKRQGYPRSVLPPFTKEEIELVKGTYDFFGFNHYTSRLIRKARDGEEIGQWPLYGIPALGAAFENHPDWKSASAKWLKVYPEGIRHQLVWLKQRYGSPKVMIVENGYASATTGLDDQERVDYYKDYLEQVLLAIREDGVNVTSYTAWSLMDNFEWLDGGRTKFGLYEVDFNDPMRRRTPRASAKYYASVVRSHSLDVPSVKYSDEL